MTQKDIDKLGKLRKSIDNMDTVINTAKRRREKFYDKVHKIHKECDHTLPDGTSAFKQVLYYGECSICGFTEGLEC